MVSRTPKVKLTAGILGLKPDLGTRVVNLEGGKREVGGDPELGHYVPYSLPHPLNLVTNSYDNHCASATLWLKFPNLSKFIGHQWRGFGAGRQGRGSG